MKTSLGTKTLLYPAPVMVVGTYNENGQANVMTAAWGGIACSQPPCISISLRSATASHGYIVSRKAFTISLPSRAFAAQADYIGLVSGRNHNKFEELGLTPVASTLVDAPYVSEFPLALECRLVAIHELGLHTQFIGEVMDVKVDEMLVTNKRQVNIEELDPILFMPDLGLYYGLGTLIGEAFSIGKKLVQHKNKA